MRTVEISKRASGKLAKLFDYLESEWSTKVKNDFIDKFDKAIDRIKGYPESCRETDYVKGLRMLVVTKQTSLVYRFNSKKIIIVTIIDNRMNPEKTKNLNI